MSPGSMPFLNFHTSKAPILWLVIAHIYSTYFLQCSFLSFTSCKRVLEVLIVFIAVEKRDCVWRRRWDWKLQTFIKADVYGYFPHLVNIFSSFIISTPEQTREQCAKYPKWLRYILQQSAEEDLPSYHVMLIMYYILISFLPHLLTVYKSIFLHELFHCYWHAGSNN